MIVTVILLSLLANLSGSMNEPGIDYSPRLLHKEISTLFRDKDYRMTELPVGSSTEGNSHINGKFFNIESVEGEDITVYIGRVNSCRSGGCPDQSGTTMDMQPEYFDYFVLFDSRKTVKLVRVFNYEATHGQEVTIKKWLDQFVGYDGATPLRVGKEIDGISGATISVSAIVSDVKEKIILLNR